MKKLYMIGNTHFDPVWLWRWDEALASIRSTFRSALDRMNENPDFIYSFCTPAVFEWIEKTDIKLFEEIKKRVKAVIESKSALYRRLTKSFPDLEIKIKQYNEKLKKIAK